MPVSCAGHHGDLVGDCLVACGKRSTALLNGDADGGKRQDGENGKGDEGDATPPGCAQLVVLGCGQECSFAGIEVLVVIGRPSPGSRPGGFRGTDGRDRGSHAASRGRRR